MKKQPSWILASCPTSLNQIEYNSMAPEDRPPYVIIGSHGFSTSCDDIVSTAYAVADAHATAASALKDATKWGKAAEKFEALSDRSVVPSTTTESMTNGSHLNVLSVLDEYSKLGTSCRVAEMYHNKDNHENTDVLHQMATLSRQCLPLNVVDHTAIVSQHAIVSCSSFLSKAAEAIDKMDPQKPIEAATSFQRNVASAELAYGVAHPSTVSPELKTSFESAKKRIAQNYSSTYPAILKAATDSFVPAGSAV